MFRNPSFVLLLGLLGASLRAGALPAWSAEPAAKPKDFSVFSIARSLPPPDGLEVLSLSVRAGRIELAKNVDGFGATGQNPRIGLFRAEWKEGQCGECDALVREVLQERKEYLARRAKFQRLLKEVYSGDITPPRGALAEGALPHSIRYSWEGAPIQGTEADQRRLQGRFAEWWARGEKLPALKAIDAVEFTFDPVARKPRMRELAGPPHGPADCQRNRLGFWSCRVESLGRARVDLP